MTITMSENSQEKPAEGSTWTLSWMDLIQLCNNFPGKFRLDDLKKRVRTIHGKDRLVFDHCLYLYDNPKMTHLPDGLTTTKSLVLRNSAQLGRLPEGLRVGENLDITKCPSLHDIPDTMEIEGDVYLDSETGITRNAKAYTHLRKLANRGQIRWVFGLPVTLSKIEEDMTPEDVWDAIANDLNGSTFLIAHATNIQHVKGVAGRFTKLVQSALENADTMGITKVPVH